MKKTIKAMTAMAVAMGMAATASAKAWTNFAGFGLSSPSETRADIKNKDKAPELDVSDVLVSNQSGISGMYMGVHNSGFAVTGLINACSCRMNNRVFGFNYDTVAIDLMVGAGFAPVRREHFTLGLFGMAGITGATGDSDEVKVPGNDYKSKYKHTYAAGQVGLNLTAVYTPTNTFSFWGSLTGTYVTSGVYTNESKHSSSSVENKKVDFDTKETYRIVPAVGICWKF